VALYCFGERAGEKQIHEKWPWLQKAAFFKATWLFRVTYVFWASHPEDRDFEPGELVTWDGGSVPHRVSAGTGQQSASRQGGPR
jgi:hypothetical protein